MKIYAGVKVYELGEHGVLRFFQKEVFHITPQGDGIEFYFGGLAGPEDQLPRDVQGDAYEIIPPCPICGK